ncbi:MAG TPA: hexitol phosphatase HxpB [Acidimicrobiales bacterium]|nr:hexitol phosphatase HxpB [Acidimicrobiales bacterium]
MIFDLDGLLIDSEPYWRQAEIEVFASVGLHLSETHTRQTMGLRIDDAVRHWWDRHPWKGMTPVEVERATTDRVAELIAAKGEPMPGALEAIDLCRRLSLPVAVCSGSYAVVIEAALRRLGVESEVTVWHSAEWETLGKPHPGSYLSTAAKLGVHPSGCLAVEDSFNGAISAKAARMRVVVVPEPSAAGSARWGFCEAVLGSLESFDEGLLRSLEG